MELGSSSKKNKGMMSNNNTSSVFEDLFPSMVARMESEAFMEELCKGFNLLMDDEKGLITFESLKRNSSSVLGLDFNCCDNKGVFGREGVLNDDNGDEMIREMVREGDLDGDGCLNLMEFCVLMFRLSPDLMAASRDWIHDYFFSV